MSASNVETSNVEMMVSPANVGMEMQSVRNRAAEVGSKLSVRLQDDSGEIASWVVFMVTLAIAVAALAGLIDTWAQTEISNLPTT